MNQLAEHRDSTLQGAPLGQPAPIRIKFRPALASDLAFVLDSWRLSWRLSDRVRAMRGRDARMLFEHVVRKGIFTLPDTEVLIGCDAAHPDRIWSWVCHTPGLVPTVHYAVTRETDRITGAPLRGLGLFTRLLAAAGVRTELVYTAKPAERANRHDERPLYAEESLLRAARAAGITATYHSAEEFLAHRGIR